RSDRDWSSDVCSSDLQITLEVGVFAAVTALAATLDPISLASHQIALNIVALTFMVPLGLSSADAVRVGHAVGGGDFRGAVRAGRSEERRVGRGGRGAV